MADIFPVLKEYIYGMLHFSLELYTWMMIIYFIASWFITNRHASWYVFLGELIDPPINKLRAITGGRLVIERFDLTPLLLFAAVKLLDYLLYMLFFRIF